MISGFATRMNNGLSDSRALPGENPQKENAYFLNISSLAYFVQGSRDIGPEGGIHIPAIFQGAVKGLIQALSARTVSPCERSAIPSHAEPGNRLRIWFKVWIWECRPYVGFRNYLLNKSQALFQTPQ